MAYMNNSSVSRLQSFSSSLGSDSGYISTGHIERNSEDSTKELLRNRIFFGRFIERKHINDVIGCKSIVLVSPAEEKMCALLASFKNKFLRNDSRWIGITENNSLLSTSPQVTLAVSGIDDSCEFGPYWFQIKKVLFTTDEISLQLKCICYISQRFLELDTVLVRHASKVEPSESINFSDLRIIFVNFLKELLKFRTLKLMILFLFDVFLGFCIYLNNFLLGLGQFVWLLYIELPIFFSSITPLFVGMFDFICRVLKQLYILFAVIFSPSTQGDSRHIQSFKSSNNKIYSVTEFD